MATWHTIINVNKINLLYINSGNRDKTYFGKFWVAEIAGIDDKYRLQRNFINDKDGALIKKDGVYQVFRTCAYAKSPEDYFIKVFGSGTAKVKFNFISKEKAIEIAASIPTINK